MLAQRIKSNVTGEVLVNGEVVKGRRFKRRMAYVLQDDIFFPKITVRNTVRDAAYLKLPKKMPWSEKRAKVEELLTEMGLQRCANTKLTPPPIPHRHLSSTTNRGVCRAESASERT